jgi:hypothetical protein
MKPLKEKANMLKTSELTGAALDWAVAKCTGMTWDVALSGHYTYKPSTDWAQGGPIIEREQIDIQCFPRRSGGHIWRTWYCDGPAPLIAAMRCYVGSKLGDEVDVPLECLIYETDEEA